MAKVKTPLLSFSASGSVADSITFSSWKGINVVKKWFKPANPRTVLQVNVRTALSLSIAKYQELTAPQKTAYDVGAEGTGKSGANLAVQRMMDAYVAQLTTAVTPLSLTNTGNYPDEVIVWSPVV